MRALPADVTSRLMESMGVTRRKGKSALSSLAEALAGPATVLKAVDALSPDARAFLYLAARDDDRGVPVDRCERVLADGRGWSRGQWEAARKELVASGLLRVEDHWRARSAPGVARAVEPLAFDWLAGATPDVPVPLPLTFVLAVVCAYCVEQPPKLRSDGGIFVKWPNKCAERLDSHAVAPARAEELAGLLASLGLLAQLNDGARRFLQVVPSALGPVFGQRPGDVALASVSGPGVAALLSRVALGVLGRASAKSPPGAWLRRSELAAAGAEFELVAETDRAYDVARQAGDALTLAQGLRFLRDAGLVEMDQSGPEPAFRRISPASPARAGRWIVQPNFDILVPEDTPPEAVARLGLVASVARLDRVATFTLSRESVQRGTELDLSEHDPIAILSSQSALAVPENVAATVRDWARRETRMRPYVGAVVVAGTDEQAQHLRASEACIDEIAPRVFLLDPSNLPDAITVAGRAGHPTERIRRTTAKESDRAVRPAAGLSGKAAAMAAALEKTLARWNAVRLEPVQPARSVQATARATLPSLRTLTTAQIWMFREKWPRVFRALRSNPRHLALACHLELRILRKMEKSKDPAELDAALSALSAAVESGEVSWSAVTGSDRDRAHPHGPDCTCDDEDDYDEEEFEFEHPPASARPRQTKAESRAPTTEKAVAHAPPPARETPWETPAPGELRRRFADAAKTGTELEILYVNSQDVQSTRIVKPLAVKDGARISIEALSRDAPGTARFMLDRISAVRVPR